MLRLSLFVSLLVQTTFAESVHVRLPASPGYRDRNVCPARCITAGPDPGNWSVYHNFDQIATCGQSVFYDFTLVDNVDDPESSHHIYACTSLGQDWANSPINQSAEASKLIVASSNVTYEVGYWPNFQGSLAVSISSLLGQIRQYLSNGFAPVDRPTLLFASFGADSIGVYIGAGLQNQNTGTFALQYLEHLLRSSPSNANISLAMQLCQQDQTAEQIFGVMASGNRSFSGIQSALTSWSKAECLSFPTSINITGPAAFTTLFSNGNHSSSNYTGLTNSSMSSKSATAFSRYLPHRDQCSTVQVSAGDSCASLAQRCGISGAQFADYNPGADFCGTLEPYQHVCCSSGSLPNFAPQTNSDGSCATYTVKTNDNCAAIAAQYSITISDLSDFNSDTWAWNGCSNLWVGTKICLSSGSPPMPAALSNAICGPQVPGTQTPPAGTNISTLNPCPLNACCDVFGQCGTTEEFCVNTRTGAPGTAAPGTNGCISNCGLELVRGSPPAVYRNIGFYEGFNFDRPCLYQEIGQIDASGLTHLFFAFGILSESFEVKTGDALSSFAFEAFVRVSGPSKVLSIGGWAFSTDPSTYKIFRQGVTAANRQVMAKNIANFVNNYNLDGVNIDWEYPGAQDIPGIPPASLDDGENYLAFLTELRAQLPNKEISIAAPASYWYLKGFPIANMSNVLDYVIYMTYDLHGQWDANNQWSQSGCITGTCLRSDVNLTETVSALVMITKAGVPSNKVVVGITSYGRSFGMAEAGCYGPDCHYLGSASDSYATPGICTETAGYIADAEIKAIINNSSRVNQNFIDSASNTRILVYDDTQWVGWMDSDIKLTRKTVYQRLSMGGTTDWATDLQEYNDPPTKSVSWTSFLSDARLGVDPYTVGNRTGNWTSLTCEDESVQNIRGLSPEQRWTMMDCPNAWSDAINVWLTVDQPAGILNFTESISDTIHGPEDASCGVVSGLGNCDQTLQCDGFIGDGSGPAGYEIWNSLVVVNEMYTEFYDAIINAAATDIDNSLAHFEDTFAPIPPPKSDEWLQILISIISLGLSVAAAPFFGSEKPNTPGVLGGVTNALLTFGAAVAKLEIDPTNQQRWTPQDQNSFSDYLGQVIFGWSNATYTTAHTLFDGSAESIKTLTALIQNGQLIEGGGRSPDPTAAGSGETLTKLSKSVSKAFYAFAIPSVWSAAGDHPFVIDSGYTCGTVNPLGTYMTTDTMQATASCVGGNLYYLVYPKGSYEVCPNDVSLAKRCPDCAPIDTCETSLFSVPPGLDALDGNAWGGITVADLVTGSVQTYKANGNQNGAAVADPTDQQTLTALANQDITTPGYITMPVCSPEVALRAWSTPKQANSSDPNYPCVELQGITDCWDYTFTNVGSSASPPQSDCLQIVANIEGTAGEWTTGIDQDRQIVNSGLCEFSVQTIGNPHGDVSYHTGAQDIVDIITQSISMYGNTSDGKIGATGTMTCRGEAAGSYSYVRWGLY